MSLMRKELSTEQEKGLQKADLSEPLILGSFERLHGAGGSSAVKNEETTGMEELKKLLASQRTVFKPQPNLFSIW